MLLQSASRPNQTRPGKILAALGPVFAIAALAAAPAGAQIPTGVTFETIYDVSKVSFLQPTYIGPVPGDPNQMIVVERAGKVSRLVKNGALYDKVPWFSVAANQDTHWDGAWNVEFHPNFKANHLFYFMYRLAGADTRSLIEEWTCDADLGNPHKLRNLIYFNQKSIHSSGDLHFGPDGYLYSSQGDRDQGALGGPLMSEMWGKVIRIDVNKKDPGLEYAIPDNPFKSVAGDRPEIWALGFRMPWRFSFDALNGDMYLGDVGDLLHEEINLVQAGKNYGAGKVEGKCTTNCGGLTDPMLELPHGCVIGGFVYRNDPASAFYGVYIYSDYVLNTVAGLKMNAAKTGTAETATLSSKPPGHISTMGVDAVGNIYVGTYVETPETTPTHIYRLKHAELRPSPTVLAPYRGTARVPDAALGLPAGSRIYDAQGRLRPSTAASARGLYFWRDPQTGAHRAGIRLP